jgi:serine/threonine protein kinase
LVAKGRLSSTEALQYFQQIISAVDYCHRFNVAHRDLKPENLLLDHDNNIKVADFGMAAWEGGAGMLETSCGSPHYASPEVVQGKAYRGYTSDVWSCGVILYALLAGRLPFDDDNIRKLLEKVKLGKYPMPTDIPLAAQHLLSRMLEKNVEKRIKMSEILIHPWFTSLPMKPLPKSIAPPPTLNITHRPVRSTSEIDVDLMANLRTLWHGATDEQITKGLLSEE